MAGLYFLSQLGVLAPEARGEISPSVIGWGNLFVPGLGATLRGEPTRGLLEATAELGTYYGGTFGVREGGFGIDGDVSIPTQGDLTQASTGLMLQQFGLKLHMWDTFYHYQQSCLEQQSLMRERNNPQPLYKGSWNDVLAAPFQWRYLSSPYVYPIILGASAFLILMYKNSSVDRVNLHTTPSGEALYGVSQGIVMPLGSEFGEEVFFRGFVEREVRGATGSLALAVLAESALFAAGHSNKLTSGVTGIYFGLVTSHLGGDLGYSIAPHFWLDVVDGTLNYLTLRRAQGKSAPLDPQLKFTIPF